MSAIAGAAVAAGWKLAAQVLAAGMAILVVGGGTAGWMLAGARDKAQADLIVAQQDNADLRSSIREQNRATEVLAREKEKADARGLAAQQQAAAAGRRFDAALGKLAGAQARTCDEAMPYVNQLLESVR